MANLWEVDYLGARSVLIIVLDEGQSTPIPFGLHIINVVVVSLGVLDRGEVIVVALVL